MKAANLNIEDVMERVSIMETEGRFALCRVGEGYSVEDKRTGERISYHRSYSGALKRWKEERKKAASE